MLQKWNWLVFYKFALLSSQGSREVEHLFGWLTLGPIQFHFMQDYSSSRDTGHGGTTRKQAVL